MAESDRIRWDQRFAQGGDIGLPPPAWLEEVDHELPHHGRALDVAAGAGRVALWLARRGLDVVAVDISEVGLGLARQAAEAQGLCIETVSADLEIMPLPDGPFDVITCFRYRQRDLFPAIRERLGPAGIFIAEVATVANLERHQHPSRRYLAEPGELEQDCAPLEIRYYQEGWSDDEALARVVARK